MLKWVCFKVWIVHELYCITNGEDWFEPALDIHTPLSSILTPFFCAPLQIASQKETLLMYKKYWGWSMCPQLAFPSYSYGWSRKWIAGHRMRTSALGLHISDFCACYFLRPSQFFFWVNLLKFSKDANVVLIIIKYFCNLLLFTFIWIQIFS